MKTQQEYIEQYLKETEEICKSVNKKDIEKFIEILFEAWKKGKKVITIGNGGSASTASHFAGDLLKTVANDSSMKEVREIKGFKAICLTDNAAALTAWINDSGWDKTYVGLLNTLLDEGDVILLLSVHGGSGWSGNMVQAMTFAKKKNAKIIGLAGFDGGKMKEMCDACIVVPEDSTPHTEGFHGVLQHLVVFRLKELIEDYSSRVSSNELKEKNNNSPEIEMIKEIKNLMEKYNRGLC
jgi:D-sedoheptulose 7-phosphate isomerase